MRRTSALLAATLVLGVGGGATAAVLSAPDPDARGTGVRKADARIPAGPATTESTLRASAPATVQVCVKKGVVVAPRPKPKAGKKCPRGAKLMKVTLKPARGARGPAGADGADGADGSAAGAIDGGAP